MPIDPKYIDVPNICFSLTSEYDSREEVFKKQRISRGFDDSELWSLRDTIGKFLIPRLAALKGKLSREEERDIDKMIRAFELLTRDDGAFELSKSEFKEFKKGLKLFYKNFLSLWY